MSENETPQAADERDDAPALADGTLSDATASDAAQGTDTSAEKTAPPQAGEQDVVDESAPTPTTDASTDAPAEVGTPAEPSPAPAGAQTGEADAQTEEPDVQPDQAEEPAARGEAEAQAGSPHPPTPASAPTHTSAVGHSFTPSGSAQFGRVAEDGTVYVRTPEGERAVGSYPGASPEEALAYFTRKFDEVVAVADLLYQRVTQTDLSAKDAADGLAHLRAAVANLNAVGDVVALHARIENIATAVEARRAVLSEQRAAARVEAIARREQIVSEAEKIAGQPENKIQWKQSSGRMRELLDEWKTAQRSGAKIDRETEQALWQRLSSSRNSFDKMRRVHFAQLGQEQSAAKAAKEELVAEAEKLQDSTEWGATAGAYKRLMDRWRQAGRASRAEDDALWKRYKAAQDHFFTAKDAVSAAENEEFKANLVVKEQLLAEAEKLLPVKDVERAKAQLRVIQDRWDVAGKVPRGDIDRMEKGMRRIEQAVREAGDKRWTRTNPEVAARAASLAEQAEAQLEKYREALAKAERSGDAATIAKAREALAAREQWLKQAQAGLAEFGQ